MVHLNSNNFKNEVLNSDIPVLVDFYADWCGPCKMVGPLLEDMSPKYNGKAKICKLNIDDHKDLARKYKVMSIPTLLFIKDGETVERISGALPQKVLEEKLNSLL